METLHALPSIQVKNILFATDFSPAATSAAAYAAEIAKHYGAKAIRLSRKASRDKPHDSASRLEG